MNPIVEELPAWLQIAIAVGPVGLLLVGLVGSGVAYSSYRQRRHADRRAEWWRRVQFAVEMALSDDPETSRVGAELLGALGTIDEATSKDTRLLKQILRIIRDEEDIESDRGGITSAVQLGARFLIDSLMPVYFPYVRLPQREVDSGDESEVKPE